MKKSKKIDFKLEDIVVEYKPETEDEKQQIAENYKDLLNIVLENADEVLNDNTLTNIEKLKIYTGLNQSICKYLNNDKYYLTLFNIVVLSNFDINYIKDETIVNNIHKNVNIYASDLDLLYRIREILIGKNDDFILLYSFLFNDDLLPLLTEDEIDLINKNNLSINIALALINPNKISVENCGLINRIVNYRKLSKEEILDFFNYIDLVYSDEFAQIIDSLDYDKSIDLLKLDEKERDRVKKIVYSEKNINNIEEEIGYLNLTKVLDEEIEKKYSKEKDINYELENIYINAINNAKIKSFNDITFENICNTQFFHIYTTKIEKILFDRKDYYDYIYSNISNRKKFSFDISITDKEYYDDCIRLLSNSGIEKIIEIMCDSEKLVDHIIKNKDYKKISNIALKYLHKGIQTADLVDTVYKKDIDFVDYLSKCTDYTDSSVEARIRKIIFSMRNENIDFEKLKIVIDKFKSKRIKNDFKRKYKNELE